MAGSPPCSPVRMVAIAWPCLLSFSHLWAHPAPLYPFRNRNSLERKASEFNAARLLRRILHALRSFLDRKAKLALLGASLHHKGQLVTKYEVLRGWRAEFQRRRMNFMRLASFWGTQALRSQHKVFRGWAHWCRRR